MIAFDSLAREAGRQRTNDFISMFLYYYARVETATRFAGYEFGLVFNLGLTPQAYAFAALRGL